MSTLTWRLFVSAMWDNKWLLCWNFRFRVKTHTKITLFLLLLFYFVREAFETNFYFTSYCSTIVFSTWEFFNVINTVFLDQSGESSAKLSPSGLVHLRSSWPLHWQLCLILFRLCEETTGHLWPSILLFWHGRAWAIKSQRRTLSSRVTWSSSGR